MKRPAIYCLTLTLLALLAFCSNAAKPEVSQEQFYPGDTALPEHKSILIVYLSRTGNTKAIAEIIHSKTGGDIIALELVTPYPQHYQTAVNQVARENEKGFLPPLKTKIDSVGKYDMVFVGFPTWGMQLPPPMKTFLNQYDLAGKTIIPFNTNGGYGTGSSFDTLKKLCPQSTVLEGFSIKGGVEKDGVLFVMAGDKEKQAQIEVMNWLRKIGFDKITQDNK